MESLKKVYGKLLTLKAPNTTITKFANTADPDDMAHNDSICPQVFAFSTLYSFC